MNQISKSLTFVLANRNIFHSLEVVDRVSDTQFQVGENSNQINNLAVKELKLWLVVL